MMNALQLQPPTRREQVVPVACDTSRMDRNERWFHPRYFQFANHENQLPFDAHFAKALIAPRALVNCHARQDYWANPYGTELTHRAAEIVFKWLDAGNRIGLHWREGKHAQNQEDWAALLDFADQQCR